MPSLIEKLETKHEYGLTSRQLFLVNEDLKPVEPARRLWKGRSFVNFWIADSFNVNTWMIAASALVDGLSWWQAWICVWIGYSITGCFIVLTARIGAQYHIGFPVIVRSSFGIWGSLWPILNRAVMACIWYGVQSWIGGQCVSLMISSIWPSFWQRDAMNAPIALGGTVNGFIGFILFWLGSLPFLWFPPQTIRHLFTVKAIVAPTAGIALFIWALVRAGGAGPIIHQPATATGSALAWGVVAGIMASVSNFATLICNSADFSRFARSTRSAFLPQLITIPVSFALTSFIGIMVGSASAVIYPSLGATWSPLELMQNFLTGGNGLTAQGSSGDRAGVFFISAAFVVAQLGTNIAANSISAGTDLTAIFPRFINIRRGSYICAVVGLIICPWQFLTSSSNFTTYLSGYSVFLSSIAGPIVIDYYFVRKGYLQIRDLYSADSHGPYYSIAGFQWRGWVAYICGILINVVGFAGATGRDVPMGATYIYRLNFFTGFIVSGLVYYGLAKVKPMPACSPTGKWLEVGDEITDVSLAEGADAGHVSDEGEKKGMHNTTAAV